MISRCKIATLNTSAKLKLCLSLFSYFPTTPCYPLLFQADVSCFCYLFIFLVAPFSMPEGCCLFLVPVFQRDLRHSGPWLGAWLWNQQLLCSCLFPWSCWLSWLENPNCLPAPHPQPALALTNQYVIFEARCPLSTATCSSLSGGSHFSCSCLRKQALFDH